MEVINGIIFYIVSFLLVLSAIFTVISKKIMNSVLFSLVVFFLFGLIYFSLNAPFNGVVQISIYGIALSILFVIAISLTDYEKEKQEKYTFKNRYLLVFLGVSMIFFSVSFFFKELVEIDYSFAQYLFSSTKLVDFNSVKQLSAEILTHNLYSFEVMGVYLLIALIGLSILFVFKGGR